LKLTEIEQKIQSHVPHEMNYAFETSVSYSKYSIYQKCPHQWYLSYVKNLRPYEPSIFTIFGDAIHETIQHYLNIMYTESATKADDIDIIEYFNERFREHYKTEYEKTKQHFSSAIEMKEFFDDGASILEYFQKHRKNYFKASKMKLLGIELPLVVKVNKNVYLKGYLDIVLYDEEEDTITIYDIKTSSRGWKNEKKDETKTSQLLIYKEFLSKQYNIDIDKINVQFFIVKRKIYETEDFVIPRIQIFEPASGKIKRKKTTESFNKFLKECFDEEGKSVEKEYPKTPSKSACKYCPFRTNKELCNVAM
jgi:hypothetical protein